LRTLVGRRTGPLTRRSRSLARLMRSAQTEARQSRMPQQDSTPFWFYSPYKQTDDVQLRERRNRAEGNGRHRSHFSSGLTLREVSVILILWILAAGAPVLSRSFS
jgi:hypothetical protein